MEDLWKAKGGSWKDWKALKDFLEAFGRPLMFKGLNAFYRPWKALEDPCMKDPLIQNSEKMSCYILAALNEFQQKCHATHGLPRKTFEQKRDDKYLCCAKKG